MQGTINGKYMIDRPLGGGGMAEVFLARTLGAEGFSRPVAIKRVLPGYSQSAQFETFFVSEAQLSARLQHPNIVSILDFDRDHEGRLFLVMELVEGTDLDGLMATGPLPFPLTIHVTTEILRGLAYAHELPTSDSRIRGIIHRDISPHNVLLSWQGAVKVSDFGIAKAREATDATASLMVKGKPAYMSPEQARGEPLDGRSDLFAVGVMLFEMLCLQPLFHGDTLAATLTRLLTAPIPDPREVRPEVPADLARIVATLLQRDRRERFANAQEVVSALVGCKDYPRDGREALVATLAERYVGRAPARLASGTPPPEARWVTKSATAAAPSATSTVPPSQRVTHARRWPWGIAAVLALAVVAVLVIAATSSPAEPPGAPVARPASPADAPSAHALTPDGPAMPVPSPSADVPGASAAIPTAANAAADTAAQPHAPAATGSGTPPVAPAGAATSDTNSHADAASAGSASSMSAKPDASRTPSSGSGAERVPAKAPDRPRRPPPADGIRQIHL